MTVEKDRYTTMILQCVEPTPEMVAKHLRFCSQLNKDALYRFSAWLHHRDEEFLVSPCYRFFSRLLDTEPVAQVRELLSDGELALIVDRAHVDSATGRFRPRVFFVKASCVFDDLPQPGFPPFAYATSMLSRSMIEDKLLAAMGVRKSPTLQDLVRWLGKYAERAQVERSRKKGGEDQGGEQKRVIVCLLMLLQCVCAYGFPQGFSAHFSRLLLDPSPLVLSPFSLLLLMLLHAFKGSTAAGSNNAPCHSHLHNVGYAIQGNTLRSRRLLFVVVGLSGCGESAAIRLCMDRLCFCFP